MSGEQRACPGVGRLNIVKMKILSQLVFNTGPISGIAWEMGWGKIAKIILEFMWKIHSIQFQKHL